MYFAELKVDRIRLVAACNAFKGCKDRLVQISFDCGNLEDLADVFQAAWELLSFFPPNESASELSMLEAQLESHKAFNMSRMSAHGWSFDSSCLAASVDFASAIANLREVLDDDQNRNAVAGLSILLSAASILDDFAIRERVTDEAWRLQVTEVVF
jgi:hypothetical protein